MSAEDMGEKLLFETIILRVFPEDKQQLELIVKKHPERYDSVSHAVRCAVQQFIREEAR